MNHHQSSHSAVVVSLLAALLGACAAPAAPVPTALPPTPVQPSATSVHPSPTPALASLPSGAWQGLVEEDSGLTYPVELNFGVCLLGEPCVEIDYSTFSCGGELTYVGREGLEYVFTENITYGQDQCLSGTTVRLRHTQTGETIQLQWFGPDGSAGPVAEIRPAEADSQAVQAPTSAPTPIVLESLGREVASVLPGGLVNWPPVTAAGSLWIPNATAGTVVRVDLATNEIIANIAVDDPNARAEWGPHSSVLASGVSVWVTQRANRAVVRIDPGTNEVVESIPLEVWPYDIALDGNTMWLTAFDDGAVVRVDMETGQVVARIDVRNPTGIAFAAGAVWAVEHRRGNLVRIDPDTNSIAATIKLGSEGNPSNPENVIFAYGSLWTANNSGKSVSRVDPETNQQVALIEFGQRVLRVAAGGGWLWASLLGEGISPSELGRHAIAQIDPEGNIVVRQDSFYAAAVLAYTGEGSLWVGDNGYDWDRRRGDKFYRLQLDEWTDT